MRIIVGDRCTSCPFLTRPCLCSQAIEAFCAHPRSGLTPPIDESEARPTWCPLSEEDYVISIDPPEGGE